MEIQYKVLIGMAIGLSILTALVSGMYISPVTETVTEYETITETVEVPVEIEKIVEVDNENLDVLTSYIEDYGTKKLNKLDKEEIIPYVLFHNELKTSSEMYIQDNIIELLEMIDAFDNELDDYRKSEVDVRNVEDAKVDIKDLDDKDAEVEVEFKLRAQEDDEDAEYFEYKVLLVYEDGELEDDFTEIELL